MTYVSMPPQITKTKITTMPPLTKVEVYVERDVLEIVASAAIGYSCLQIDAWKREKIAEAVKSLQAAVRRNDFDAPLDTNRL